MTKTKWYAKPIYLLVALALVLSLGIVALPMAGTVEANPGGPWYVSTTGDNTNDGLSWTTAFRTIQHAVDVADAGDTIHVAAGTYEENIDVDKAVTVTGAGQANTEIQGSATITAPDGPDRVVLQELTVISPWETSPYVVDTYYAIYIDAEGGNTAPVTIQNVTGRTTPTTTRVYGAGLVIGANGNTVDDVVIDTCTFNENSTHGMFIENLHVNGGFVTNVTLTNSTFDDNDQKGEKLGQGWGLYIKNWPYQNGPFVNHFTVTNCSFNGHDDKGIYVESLSNATFTNVTANNNYKEGFDINLKGADYENLVFNDCTFVGNGTTTGSAGLIIKGRNDGSYAEHPSSINNVDINGGTFSGNGMGISVGNNVSDVEIHYANISGNYNIGWGVNAGVINWTDSATIDATNNWWGDADGPQADPGQVPDGENVSTGDKVSDNVHYDPWLTSPYSPVIEVDIDIKPGSYPNSINLKSKGVVPVAMLSTEDFDASTVDPETVGFLTTKNYGDVTLYDWWKGNFDDVWDLTQGDLTLSYTIDMSAIANAGWAVTEVGLRETGGPNIDPNLQGGWMQSNYIDATSNPNLQNNNDMHLLSKHGWSYQKYDASDADTLVAPYWSGANYGFWFDRDGVDEWQAQMWGMDGTYDTGGVYDIVITYHAIDDDTGTMFGTINGVQQGLYIGGWKDAQPEFYPAGRSFEGDMTKMQLFYGRGGGGGYVTVSDITVTGRLAAGASLVRWTLEDVDGDGDLDLLLHFKTQELNLGENSTEATLTGATYGGQPIQGTDTVNIIPKDKGKK